MKTKVKIFLLICLLSTLTGVSAQTYYYNTTKTFVENGYTYQCISDPNDLMVRLFNTLNLKTNAEQTFKDGSPLSERILMGYENLIVTDDWTWTKCHSIVNNAFSTVEKQKVKDSGLEVRMTINTDTGKVMEIEFSFLSINGLATIPVSVYRKIELELKSNVWFTLTDVGKNLNFIQRSWIQEIK